MGQIRQNHIASMKRHIGCDPNATHMQRAERVTSDADWLAEHVLDGLEQAELGHWDIAARVWAQARETLGKLGHAPIVIHDALTILQNSITDRLMQRK